MPKTGTKENTLKNPVSLISTRPINKPRRKKRRDDSAYNPKTYSKRKKIRTNTALDPQNTMQLMGVTTPQAPQMIIKGHRVDTPTKSDTKIVRSPNYTVENQNNNEVLFTPSKEKPFVLSRAIETSQGGISTYLPANKVKESRLIIPKIPTDEINDIAIPEVSLEPIIDKKISITDIQQAKAEKQKAQKMGCATREPSQKHVMTISARDAVQKATNIEIEPKLLHWTHFLAHSFFGNATQIPDNLGITTKYCNAEMELINPVIRKILQSNDHPDELYLSIYPTWVNGYEKIRLLDRLTMQIKNAPGDTCDHFAKIEFDALTLKAICTSEIEVIEKILLDIFNLKKSILSKEISSFAEITDCKTAPSCTDDALLLAPSESQSTPALTPLFNHKQKDLDLSCLPKPCILPETKGHQVLKPT